MAVQQSFSLVRRAALGLAAGALALLGGCVVAPVDGYGYGYDTGAPVVDPDASYSAPYYYGAPAYYGTPYYGPNVSLGIYGGSYNDRRWRGYDGWRGHNNPGWRGNNPPGWRGNNGWRGDGGRGNWNGNHAPRPPVQVQPRPPRPPAPNNGVRPAPNRDFGTSGMGIDRRGGTPGNP